MKITVWEESYHYPLEHIKKLRPRRDKSLAQGPSPWAAELGFQPTSV